MWLKKLQLQHFRNIQSAQITLSDKGPVVLYGHNGAGKTNLLEALSLLSPGQGLHRAAFNQMKHNKKQDWGLFAELENKHGHQEVGMRFLKGKRQIQVNGQQQGALQSLAQLGAVVWFTPKMDRLFVDAPAARRQFLDRLVFGHFPKHAEHLSQYEKQMKNRLKMLKEGNPDPLWLKITEQQLAEAATKITLARQKFLTRLNEKLGETELILSGAIEKLEPESLQAAAQEEFKNCRMRDAKFGSTHFGPHRSELSGFLHLKKTDPTLKESSMGQHKRAVLSVLIANAELLKETINDPPLVLLDETFAHLDKTTRELVAERLEPLSAQLWLTGTDKEAFEVFDKATFLEISEGEIKV